MSRDHEPARLDLDPELDHLPDHVRIAASVAARGWPVIAIRTGTKVPLHGGSLLPNHGDHWLRSPQAVQATWESAADPWTGQTGCTFAAITGQPNAEGESLVALDADVDGDWSLLDSLLADAGADAIAWAGETLRVQRCPDRAHLWGTVTGICPQTRELVKDAVEWRGDGGYVLLSGALHQSGTRYVVTLASAPLPVPSGLLALAWGESVTAASDRRQPQQPAQPVRPEGERRPRERDRGSRAYDRLLDALGAQGRTNGRAEAHCPGPNHRNGDRHPSLSVSDGGDRALLKCHAGCTAEEVMAALGLTVGDLFDPPDVESFEFVEQETEQEASSGAQESPEDEAPEALLQRLTKLLNRPDFAALVDNAFLRVAARAVADRAHNEMVASESAERWFGATGEAFDPDTPEPEPCVLEIAPGRFVFPPGVCYLFGPRSTLKTWLAYKAVVQEVKRGEFALILDYEMSYDETMRRLSLLGASADDLSRVVYVDPADAPSDAGRNRLAARFADRQPSVAVIDSAGMSMAAGGWDENDGKDSAEWTQALPGWMKKQWPAAVILIIDHVPKGAMGATDPIGSQRKGAIASGLYSIEVLSPVSRAKRGKLRLIQRKGRQGYGDDNTPVADADFGGDEGRGPFVLSPPDPQVATVSSAAVGDAGNDLVRIAREVGRREGQTVEVVRKKLKMRSGVFTAAKNTLAGMGVLDHRSGKGLYKGERWGDYIAEHAAP